MIYLDASIIVPLLVEEARSSLVASWLSRQTEPICTGRLAIGEVYSAFARRCRMGLLDRSEVDRILMAFDAWLDRAVSIVEHESADLILAAELVRQPTPALLMPDAIHAATCLRLDYRLATDDHKLTLAAQARQIDWTTPD